MEPLKIKNEKMYVRYLKFINSRNNRKIKTFDFVERHHIIPKSCGGSDLSSNIIVLTAREHFIAHWILFKALGGSQAAAFWMMCNDLRNKHYRYVNSRAYEMARKMYVKFITEYNTGWVVCYDTHLDKNSRVTREEFLSNDRYESPTKGKASYFLDGKVVQLSTNDPRIDEGVAVSIRTGYKHKQSTKDKMSENGIKDRILITNIDSGERRYIKKNEIVPSGFIIGMSDESVETMRKRNKEIFSAIKWITNGIDNNRIVIYSESDIPDGWRIGRTLEKITCPYCNKTVDKPNYTQHHGERCKHKMEAISGFNSDDNRRTIELEE